MDYSFFSGSVLHGFAKDARSDANVPKQLFMLFVLAAAILPRMPNDGPFEIGGDLSNGFRKLLLLIVVMYFARHLVLQDTGATSGFFLFMYAIEATLATVLSLLTPYLMRRWLQQNGRNMPRSPGYGLQSWVVAAAVLSWMGALTCTITHNPDWWVWKKVADALSFVPVRMTLQSYNQHTTWQMNVPGRGMVLSQLVMIGEYYAFATHAMDVTIKLILLSGLRPVMFRDSVLVRGIYASGMFAVYARILCHAILLNHLDEQNHIHLDNNKTKATTGASPGSESTSSSMSAAYTSPRRFPAREYMAIEGIDDSQESVVALV